MPSALRTLEQGRAQHAWVCVQECLEQAIKRLERKIDEITDQKQKGELQKRLNRLRDEGGASEWKGKYGSLVRKVPSYIITNGLGQTLAFLRAKGKGEPDNEHEILYGQLSEWVGGQLGVKNDLLDWIVNTATSQQYRLATMEALAFLQWLKRFAEAELPKGREE